MFAFLGFDFYWAKTQREFRTVKRRTSAKKFRVLLSTLKEWLRDNRNRRLRWLGEGLAAKFQGHWSYYGLIGSSQSLQT